MIMWVLGLTCLMPCPTFVEPQYRIITHYVSETTAGLIALAFGTSRIVALYINGRPGRETSFVRTLGCLAGYVSWLAMALGFALAFPPLSLSAGIYTVFAIAELPRSAGRPTTWPPKTPSASGNGEGPVPATAQQLDGWPGNVIALLGAFAAVLVLLTGFMNEWWGYRKEVRAA
ncbi:hypothetical protein R1A27_06390 [Methylobacterium sp. NMS12]|uniref:hypothetical protein n=1 Tax=Methylobacterium sp. NMS12 TaxID=3079766 RepID=UPI003F882912